MNFVLNDNNLKSYLANTYGDKSFYEFAPCILNITPLLQKDYGGDMDCSLVSILTILLNKNHISPLKYELESHYKTIEKIAKKYFYKENFGTLPFFIRPIMKNIFTNSISAKYIKGIGFNFETIKKQINLNNPMILSMWNDGRDVYKNHSVVVIGYRNYKINNYNVNIIIVYDNWSTQIRYIDYTKLSKISSLHFVNE